MRVSTDDLLYYLQCLDKDPSLFNATAAQAHDSSVSHTFNQWVEQITTMAKKANIELPFDVESAKNLRSPMHSEPTNNVGGGNGSEGKLEASVPYLAGV